MPNGSMPPPPPDGPPRFPPSPLPPPTPASFPAPSYSPASTTPLQPPASGARKAVGVLMWSTVAGELLTALAAFARRSRWDSFVDGNATISDLDAADDYVAAAAILTLALTVATGIVLAVWSHRAASNARARGAGTSPGWASGGWFIPIGNLFVPFVQLRKALRIGGEAGALNAWQGLWITGAVIGNAGARAFGDFEIDDTPSNVANELRNQGIALLVGAIVLGAAAYCATRAMRSIDEVTTGTS